MKARIVCVTLVLMCVLLLSGCWDYRGMDKINIVAGLAVDQAEDGGYEVTMELVNIAETSEGSGQGSLMVSAEGPTIFEAVRNAKKKLYNDLYFGSMRTIIVSEEIAKNPGVLVVIDGFIRDMETRETIVLAVSQEDTAKEIITTKGLDSSNISFEIAKIVMEDQKVDSSSRGVQLYEAFNYVQAKGLELILPAFRLTKNDGEDVAEINGVAIFKGDKFVSYLSPEETHYFLLATDPEARGAFSFTLPDSEESVALEIMKCTNKPEVQYADGKVSVRVTVDVSYKIVEISGCVEPISDDTLKKINAQAETVLTERITEVFNKTQADPGLDIYGYGNLLYEDQYHVWKEIKDRWDELYKEADFNVEVNATDVNVGIAL